MHTACTNFIVISALGAVAWMAGVATAATGDFDEDGFVSLGDYRFFATCFVYAEPRDEIPTACLEGFDADADGDIDLKDYAAFQVARGHLPIPLKNGAGEIITLGSTDPYSPRKTCGDCHFHEADVVANGEWFQQGRTDLDGNVDMRDDYYGDGRDWIKSSGRYGKWGQSFQYLLAGKQNAQASDIDQTSFAWVRDCSGCHSGSGPGERDRNGELYYNDDTGQFGYEITGNITGDIALDGDYGRQDKGTSWYAAGAVSEAPWDQTGVSEPDCLLCHRANRPKTPTGGDAVRGWRYSAIVQAETLKDNLANPVRAYAAAPTIGQGWFAEVTELRSAPERASGPDLFSPTELEFLGISSASHERAATTDPGTRTIDYSKGVEDGGLSADPTTNELALLPSAFAYPPKDRACESCHVMAVVWGANWFTELDVHYKFLNNRNDDDPDNDISDDDSTACSFCHAGAIDHNAAKGNSFQLQYRNELDYATPFRACRDCHLADSPVRHPDAPEIPPEGAGFENVHNPDHPMSSTLSCQACHIPYATKGGVIFRDITIPMPSGSVGTTGQYYSTDPLDPMAQDDDSRWHPALRMKVDSDGVERLFPCSIWINIYWADWDTKGTESKHDDVIAPIITWRMAQVYDHMDPHPFDPDPDIAIIKDDDGDGRPEINRAAEILPIIEALKGVDDNGVVVAENPVLVRGERVFYQDPDNPNTMLSFNHTTTVIPITSYPYIWGMDHNVLVQEEAWGQQSDTPNCQVSCHGTDTPVFDRLILVDPLDENNQRVYKSVRELSGVSPPG